MAKTRNKLEISEFETSSRKYLFQTEGQSRQYPFKCKV